MDRLEEVAWDSLCLKRNSGVFALDSEVDRMEEVAWDSLCLKMNNVVFALDFGILCDKRFLSPSDLMKMGKGKFRSSVGIKAIRVRHDNRGVENEQAHIRTKSLQEGDLPHIYPNRNFERRAVVHQTGNSGIDKSLGGIIGVKGNTSHC